MRGYGWENAVDNAIADLRYALRRLRASPMFTAIAELTLALGLGATTAIFSVVNPILFEPLPYPNANRIIVISELGTDGSRNSGTFAMYREMAARARVIRRDRGAQTMAANDDRPGSTGTARGPTRQCRLLPRARRSPDARTSSRHRTTGRTGLTSPSSATHCGAAASVLIARSSATKSSSTTTATCRRRHAAGFENVSAPSAELWAPLQYDTRERSRMGPSPSHHRATPAGRQLSIARHARSTTIGRVVIAEQRPETYDPATRFGVNALQDDMTRGVRPALLAIIGAVMLVLVIACVNVTNLLLARGAQRRGEFALRAALGAGHGRLIRQLLTESLVLAVIGGVLGMVVATLGVRALIALSPPGLPRVGASVSDGTVFAFGLGLTTLIGLAFGLIPALQAARNDPQPDLQHGSRRTAGGHRRTRCAARGRRGCARARAARRARGCCCAAFSGCSPSTLASTPRTCSRCRCRRRDIDSTTTRPGTVSSRRRSKPFGAFPASRRRVHEPVAAQW